MPTDLLFIHALTSIHPGTGQGVGVIDLPIARERATNIPVIHGSSVKGSLNGALSKRAKTKGDLESLRIELFGKSETQGRLRVSDARLLLLPVRCPGSIFVWVTSHYVLKRFQRECKLLGVEGVPERIYDPGELDAHMADPRQASTVVGGKASLILEDLSFDLNSDPTKIEASATWARWFAEKLFGGAPEWANEFRQRFVILGDTNFDFLAEFATEVTAHVSIGKNGTVESGALWYEETLPAETIFCAALESDSGVNYAKAVPAVLRIGGNETTGQGLVRLVLGGTGA